MVFFEVDIGSGVRDFRIFIFVDDIKMELEELKVVWIDGDRLDIIVCVIDIFNQILDENIMVFCDVILLIIENFWLIKEDRFNISVYSFEDFV